MILESFKDASFDDLPSELRDNFTKLVTILNMKVLQ